MNNETYLDFCFVKPSTENFSKEIDNILSEVFKNVRVNWYLEEKSIEGAQVVVAEVKGMSRFDSEDDVITHLEKNGGEEFWNYLQGYQLYVYSNRKGCGSCGNH
ncbi:hypothetical protein SM124_07565 [Bacillus sp. 31A1R]|uniref:Uncharacterized protein n=1 Tax=Robertmurraya mangrovi TaxID=3098077 RepID=A0ABU5IWR3_9BACI|nr:hypothetical protein [Bacillus sp. 31A1R]MDZ5471604.1 hypothetical protein [Bacillus sp. 31A1R]